jgi:hypothetical protein
MPVTRPLFLLSFRLLASFPTPKPTQQSGKSDSRLPSEEMVPIAFFTTLQAQSPFAACKLLGMVNPDVHLSCALRVT